MQDWLSKQGEWSVWPTQHPTSKNRSRESKPGDRGSNPRTVVAAGWLPGPPHPFPKVSSHTKKAQSWQLTVRQAAPPYSPGLAATLGHSAPDRGQ